MKEFIIGGAAAMSASMITHPIDLIKVRMLLHGEAQPNQIPKLNLVPKIIKTEGVPGLYRGLSAALTRQALYSTTRFGFYDLIKRNLQESNRQESNRQESNRQESNRQESNRQESNRQESNRQESNRQESNRQESNRNKEIGLPYSHKVIATVLGGSSAALVACPADLMLVRMQADGRLSPYQRRNYRNVFDGLYRVAKEEGISGWYRGIGPLVTRGVMVTTAQFSTYDQVKETLMKKYQLEDTLPVHFASSAVAGGVAALVSTPLDVIKSRMMNSTQEGQHGSTKQIRYTSSWNCFWQTLRIEGVRGLFKGLIPCYLRMGPQVILMWNFVEQYRRLWDYFFED